MRYSLEICTSCESKNDCTTEIFKNLSPLSINGTVTFINNNKFKMIWRKLKIVT